MVSDELCLQRISMQSEELALVKKFSWKLMLLIMFFSFFTVCYFDHDMIVSVTKHFYGIPREVRDHLHMMLCLRAQHLQCEGR